MAAELPGFISAWYDRFEMYVRSHEVEPCDIYNFDETGYQISQGKPERVVTKNKFIYSPNGGLNEGITGIECILADGWIISPWFLVKGRYHMENWYKTTSL